MIKQAAFGLPAVLIMLAFTTTAFAQVDEPTKVENERYSFAFTVEADSFVTYQEEGDGFSSIHNPAGGGKGTKPDYGLLVFGGLVYIFSAEQAAAARLDPPEVTTLSTEDIGTNARFAELMIGAMSAHDREPEGYAKVRVEGGGTIEVPYFTWSRTAGSTTHHALMYAVMHGPYFITVQVELSRPPTKKQIEWFTNNLELLKIEGLPEEMTVTR